MQNGSISFLKYCFLFVTKETVKRNSSESWFLIPHHTTCVSMAKQALKNGTASHSECCTVFIFDYLTYSITTQRLGSTPVEWVVMFSISCRAAWIT